MATMICIIPRPIGFVRNTAKPLGKAIVRQRVEREILATLDKVGKLIQRGAVDLMWTDDTAFATLFRFFDAERFHTVIELA